VIIAGRGQRQLVAYDYPISTDWATHVRKRSARKLGNFIVMTVVAKLFSARRRAAVAWIEGDAEKWVNMSRIVKIVGVICC
jgi:hypothetical protein